MSITTTFAGSSVRNSKLSTPPFIPDGYLFLTPPYFKNLSIILENRNALPKSIIVDLDTFQIEHFSSALNSLRQHENLMIPVIGISKEQRKDTKALIAAGLDDCFFGELDWYRISKRVQFLSEFKQLQQEVPQGEELKEYQMPFSKRLFDIVASSVGLIILSPFFLLLAILIKLESKGPVFYAAKRIGTGYQAFDFMKFRSMGVNADKELQKLAHLNSYEGQSDDNKEKENDKKNTFFKIKNDPRVTRVGWFIRKTSIDELPQLINVFRGEMSIIGNRPLPLYEAEQLTKDEWAQRFLAPAGITGLWQVDKRGKDNLSTEERVGLDIEYANGVSMSTDLKILLGTIPAMWQRD